MRRLRATFATAAQRHHAFHGVRGMFRFRDASPALMRVIPCAFIIRTTFGLARAVAAIINLTRAIGFLERLLGSKINFRYGRHYARLGFRVSPRIAPERRLPGTTIQFATYI